MTTPERSVDTICQCRKGSMDDKQFRATVEYNIQSLLTAERQKREIVLKGERRRIIEQIREERDTYWKERVMEGLSDDEIDARVATCELATDEQRKYIEMGMLDYRQAVIDKFTNEDKLK